jgi:hypothetical protein
MNMNYKQISLAVMSTLLAGQAVAAIDTFQSTIGAARGSATTVLHEGWISGASAPTANIFNAFKSGCKKNATTGLYTDLSIYSTSTAAGVVGALGNFNAYACTRASDDALTVFYHSVDNGSYTAYGPHVAGTTASLANLKRVANIGSNNGCVANGTTNGANLFTNCVSLSTSAANRVSTPTKATGPLVPAGGFSDVEASLFSLDLKPTVGIETDLKVNQTFGVVVTPQLYRALQTAQGLTDVDADTYLPANAPNITSQQYTQLIRSSTQHTNWESLLPSDANKLNAVKILRRTSASGTQAASNSFFLQNPCANAKPLGKLTPSGVADNDPGVYEVSESTSTGNLKIAFKAAVDSANKYAIGVMSLENNYASETTANSYYRFVKLDGVHPEANGDTYATANSMNGQYKFFMAMKSFIANSQASTYGATLISEIGAALSTPALADCDSSKLRGLFLDKFSNSSCTKSTATKDGKNCSPIMIYK